MAKNKKGFYKTSANGQIKKDSGADYVSIRCSEQQAWAINVEWHHSAGGYLDFFSKNEIELKKINKLKKEIDFMIIKSKAAFWREVAQDSNKNMDFGFGKIEARNGKFGWFKNSFGEPDATFGLSEIASEYLNNNINI